MLTLSSQRLKQPKIEKDIKIMDVKLFVNKRKNIQNKIVVFHLKTSIILHVVCVFIENAIIKNFNRNNYSVCSHMLHIGESKVQSFKTKKGVILHFRKIVRDKICLSFCLKTLRKANNITQLITKPEISSNFNLKLPVHTCKNWKY